SGIGPGLAENIVTYRQNKGAFRSRRQLLEIPMLGEKAFEQCAGFLRIRSSEDPLDNSAIHPESYHVVERISTDLSVDIVKLIGNKDLISRIRPEKYVTEEVGMPTLQDIIKELYKPGLDPRREFANVEFRPDITDLDDLKTDMKLFGKVTNVTAFGAFVDIGVHQDGLIHISRLAKKFIKDPHEVISVGERVRVRILSVDTELKRIELERLS
ncbi:MAG: S1 RNA-binding domain-containing protein, partial [Candidatus Omnitrophica bacterium]|nr:S1 RNA-binding domain-containing protein [Candidatus Omnitrophota bacterium]